MVRAAGPKKVRAKELLKSSRARRLFEALELPDKDILLVKGLRRDGLLGYQQRDIVAIDADLRGKKREAIVLHELFHAAGGGEGGAYTLTAAAEGKLDAAERFAQAALQEAGQLRGWITRDIGRAVKIATRWPPVANEGISRYLVRFVLKGYTKDEAKELLRGRERELEAAWWLKVLARGVATNVLRFPEDIPLGLPYLTEKEKKEIGATYRELPEFFRRLMKAGVSPRILTEADLLLARRIKETLERN